MQDILQLSATRIAALVRDKQLSPTEIVEAHIAKVLEVNPRLNAMVEDRFDEARAEAANQTERLAKNEETLPPLFGVPFTVKEMISLTGMKRTAGNIHRRDDIQGRDASAVARLRQAGAIPLCTTNVPELGFWFESDNPVYGRTNNPYDPARTCGGSSGGEGALIGAGASPFGVGSDIGGSIRMPAFFCGVFGHKPTNRRIPLTGHFPYSIEDMKALADPRYPYTTIGALSRHAEDLRILFDLIRGPDGIDSQTVEKPSRPFPKDPKQWRVFVIPSPRLSLARSTDQDLQDCVKKSGRYFEALGATVEEAPADLFLRGVEMWGAALKATKDSTFEQALSPEGRVHLLKEAFHLLRGRPNYTLPSLGIVFVENLLGQRLKDSTAVLEELEKKRLALDALLGDDGILLFPPHSRPAPRHGAVMFTPFDFIYTGIFNALGHPAVSVPMGLDDLGLPLGVQVIASRFGDPLALKASELLADAFGGWQPPLS